MADEALRRPEWIVSIAKEIFERIEAGTGSPEMLEVFLIESGLTEQAIAEIAEEHFDAYCDTRECRPLVGRPY